MASSYTEGLVIELIGSGDKAGSWGDVTNSNLQALNQGISGFSDIDLTGATGTDGSPYIVDLVDAQAPSESTSPSRSSVIRFSNQGTDAFVIRFQTNSAASTRINSIIVNGHASRSLVVGTGTGGTVTIPATYSARVHGDGSGLENSFANLAVDKLALKNNEIISNETNDQIVIAADTVKVGDDGAATLSSNGDQDLILKTGNSTTGNITLVDGSNGDISITPEGSGKVVMDKVNIGGGEIDGTPIGANAANTGAFTTLGATGTSTLVAINSSGNIQTSGNISTTGSGSITAANGLTASGGNISGNGSGLTGTASGFTAGSAGSITGVTTSNIVQLTDTQTLTNKTLTSPDINTPDIDGGNIDGANIGVTSPGFAQFSVIVGTGASSAFHLPNSGAYASFGTTSGQNGHGIRENSGTLNVKNTNSDGWGQPYHAGMVSGEGAYFESTCAVTANTEVNLTTGFSSIPSLVTTYLECTTANAGYSIGDHVLISSTSVLDTGSTGISVTFDGSASDDVTVTIGSGGLYLLHKTTNGETALTGSSWRLRVKAYK
jgi:hypothetical protein